MYRLERTTTRSAALDRDMVKTHLRVDHSYENAFIDSLIYAAQDMLEPPDGWLGRALSRATYRLSLVGFSDLIKLPAPPFVSLTSFKYFDTDGDEQDVDTDVYRVVEKDIAFIEREHGESWPTVECGREYPITVTYLAGYEDTDDIPYAIRAFMMMQIAQFYGSRSLASPQQLHGTPFTAAMLESFRVRL